ncbi:silent information regulator protein Sir2 [Caballeronia sordidicola]|uniref:protein acetyllysine N-acetyltransferase n=1 Tax=Caballeronia sordidicola TaxID=196367 RepID=A0A158F9D0_CABSO|nr:Sir2 family NAD-dependent protein deacetylase [Caballeronia sordidicola]SAL16347.1 silent information regulator protein Sir2 [Caballeronia sordidicola]
MTMINSTDIQRAADWIRNADGIVIAAGAGMSVDSGLPDFRGTDGLWTSLLPVGMTERDVGSLTQGDCFVEKPVDAWRFYGRALQVCRQLKPHPGYAMLKRWAEGARHGAFVFTSNVDATFRRRATTRRAFWSVTAPSTSCSATNHAATRSGHQVA